MAPGTKDRLVEAAAELFWTQGFGATSVAEVLDRSEVNSGSLYHYFRSKDSLLVAVLDHYKEQLWPSVLQPAFDSTTDPVERIFILFETYRAALASSGVTGGSPIGNLTLEVADRQPLVQARLAENFAEWIAAVERCLADADDRLPPDVDRRDLAGFVVTVLEGAILLARAFKSLKPFDAAVRQLRYYFGRLEANAAALRQPAAESGEETA